MILMSAGSELKPAVLSDFRKNFSQFGLKNDCEKYDDIRACELKYPCEGFKLKRKRNRVDQNKKKRPFYELDRFRFYKNFIDLINYKTEENNIHSRTDNFEEKPVF